MVAAPPLLIPLRYPSRGFERFERWDRHFECMSNATNCDDTRQREILPLCLDSYALDEYYTRPNHFFQQVQEQSAPTIAKVQNAFNRIGGFQNARSARTELKNLQLLESEPGSFTAATRKATALDAISKAESSRLRGRKNRNVRWTKGEQYHGESTTADLRALHTSMSSGLNDRVPDQKLQ